MRVSGAPVVSIRRSGHQIDKGGIPFMARQNAGASDHLEAGIPVAKSLDAQISRFVSSDREWAFSLVLPLRQSGPSWNHKDELVFRAPDVF
jgi:hypothetical protein